MQLAVCIIFITHNIYSIYYIYIYFYYMCVCPLEGNLLLFLKEVFYAAFIWLKYKTVIQWNIVK